MWIRGTDCWRKGRGGAGEGEFSVRDEVSLRPIPEGFGVTKRKNKRDQDQGLLTGTSQGKSALGTRLNLSSLVD